MDGSSRAPLSAMAGSSSFSRCASCLAELEGSSTTSGSSACLASLGNIADTLKRILGVAGAMEGGAGVSSQGARSPIGCRPFVGEDTVGAGQCIDNNAITPASDSAMTGNSRAPAGSAADVPNGPRFSTFS